MSRYWGMPKQVKHKRKLSIKPAHDKTYHKTCVTSKDSGQPVNPPSIARVLVYLSSHSLEAAEGPCDQRRLWSDCADAQADLNLRWSHKSYCRFCHALAPMVKVLIKKKKTRSLPRFKINYNMPHWRTSNSKFMGWVLFGAVQSQSWC